MKRADVAVFTEHFNATYAINFAAPFGPPAEARGAQGTLALSGDELAALSPDNLRARLTQECSHHPVRVAVLSRCVGASAMVVRDFFAARSVPVLLHLDDWLFEVPTDLGPTYAHRYGEAFRADLQRLIERVDGVLCSTPALTERVRSRTSAVPVVTLPGVWYRPLAQAGWPVRARLARAQRRFRARRRCVVGYAGSRSHARDLALVLPSLHYLMERHAQVHFQTFGLPVPESMAQRFPGRTASVGFSPDYGGYLRALYELGWDIGLAPLVDDEFNRCKTATKLAEYTGCGVPALCADLEPYRRVWAVARDDAMLAPLVPPWGWAEALERWVADPAARQAAWCAADRSLRAAGLARPGPSVLAALDEAATRLAATSTT